ncbi:MAG: hypothetical protein HZC40_19240 [Chloroflexi bacterium]|nr:hypothetical protein [Chloroflexota bacterium]
MPKIKSCYRVVRTRYTVEQKTIDEHADEFQGQYVVVVGKDIAGSKNGDELFRLFRQMEKRHPKRVPLISFVPEKDKIYIL